MYSKNKKSLESKLMQCGSKENKKIAKTNLSPNKYQIFIL